MAWSCRSHSPHWSQIGQSSGWLMSRNSITPSRAFFTSLDLVLTSGGSPLGPGRQSRTPQAQLATGLGEPFTSTRHMRQLPAIDRRSWKQKRGISAPAASHACSSVYSAGTSISLPSTMSLVIAISGLSQLAVWRCKAGGLQGRLHPLLGLGAVGGEIGRLRRVLLAQERQMRLQVVVAGGLPFALVGEGGDRLLAGVEEVRDEALILRAFVTVGRLDGIVVGIGEFRILERQIGVAQKRRPRAGGAVVVPDLVDLEQDRNKAEQRHGRLRHLRQRPVSLPPEARLRHYHHSAATILTGSSMPASSMSALCEYWSIRSSIS